jgi:hypothetical protein
VKLVAHNGKTTQTLKVASTGKPVPWYTVTGVENLSLPTVNANAGLVHSPSHALSGVAFCLVAMVGAAGTVLL